jgi:hypothetical protein
MRYRMMHLISNNLLEKRCDGMQMHDLGLFVIDVYSLTLYKQSHIGKEIQQEYDLLEIQLDKSNL